MTATLFERTALSLAPDAHEPAETSPWRLVRYRDHSAIDEALGTDDDWDDHDDDDDDPFDEDDEDDFFPDDDEDLDDDDLDDDF